MHKGPIDRGTTTTGTVIEIETDGTGTGTENGIGMIGIEMIGEGTIDAMIAEMTADAHGLGNGETVTDNRPHLHKRILL